jgi:hypothetical protein
VRIRSSSGGVFSEEPLQAGVQISSAGRGASKRRYFLIKSYFTADAAGSGKR